ncbi:unnamed protein product [Anisakis simplex]|uniref:HTH TFE/IIEalpha-type domain-containing protein n=1 Tax=Anisakis simplex TaxID=6269 RepID=A0A0M3JZJ7_ANISI|nr:unnamed protein product [Anisakis simplex]
MTDSSSTSSEERREDEQKSAILDELPPELLRFGLFIAKAFYGREHYVVLDYIQKRTCYKEDDLRQITKFDQRMLRGVLIQLKVDKILKERILTEENESRPRKVIYYYINYRALLNVAKYKIDHMRQRLEVKDKDEVHKASYRCSGCAQHYDVMEIDKIFDPFTQEMRCWRCQQLVEPDETAGPTDETRSSLARFNDQMAPLFAMIQSLDRIRLAPHLLEPPIKLETAPDESDMSRKVLHMGARAFQGNQLMSRSTMYQNGITETNRTKQEETSVEARSDSVTANTSAGRTTPSTSSNNSGTSVTRSSSSSSGSSSNSTVASRTPSSSSSKTMTTTTTTTTLSEEDSLSASSTGYNVEAKRAKLDDISASDTLLNGKMDTTEKLNMSDDISDADRTLIADKNEADSIGDEEEDDTDNDNVDDEEEEEEDTVLTVGGKEYYLDEINADLVKQMTAAERNLYIHIMREKFDF